MDTPEESLARARGLLAAGRWLEAKSLLERVPEADVEGEFLTARAEEGLGEIALARDRLLRLRARLATPSPALELQLGILHRRLGEADEAIAAMREAIRLKPGFTAAHQHLADALAGSGDRVQAQAALEAALAAAANDAKGWLALALAQTQSGDAGAAIASLGRAAAAGPGDAPTWAQIGYLFAEHLEYAQADPALDRASALDPGNVEVELARATVRQELGDSDGALQALALAAARDPDDPRVAIARRLFLPQSYESVEEVARWRARYGEGLTALERECERWMPRAGDVFELARTNFFLAYQGEDDRELQRRYSALIARLADAAAPGLRAPMPITYDGRRRLRVGFFGNLFRESTAGRYFERWVTGLDAARFERFVYHTAPVADALTRRVAAAAEHFFDERLDARATAEAIRSHGLDVLVYPEVGMSSLTCLLAMLRLAPVQCAGWGHPVTTGSDAIDYFFTCAAMEPPDGQDHYTERLIALPGIGVDYAMPPAPPPVARHEIGLPDDARVYVCAQSLFKIHPGMDDLFARVLAEDPQGVLVLFQAPVRAVTEQLAARIERALAARGVAPRRQIKFLPRMPGPQFRGALAVADVVLDTVRFSGGNTTLDAFAAGVPVIATQGRFLRGRQTSAMLGMLGLAELVARDSGDYARLAVEVARDRDLNARLRRTIAERRGALFDRREPVIALQDALLGIAAR